MANGHCCFFMSGFVKIFRIWTGPEPQLKRWEKEWGIFTNHMSSQETLLKMRTFRMGLIQTEDQLKFSYLSIIEVLLYLYLIYFLWTLRAFLKGVCSFFLSGAALSLLRPKKISQLQRKPTNLNTRSVTTKCNEKSSVVDPNTLNFLEPNLEFWLNFDPDPGLPMCY